MKISNTILALFQLTNEMSASAAHKFMAKLYFLHLWFHEFGQAKFPDAGSALGSSQLSIKHQQHQKMMLASIGVKID